MLLSFVSATNFILPDGNSVIGMQFDGNYVSNNTTYLTPEDVIQIDRIASEGYTVLSMDVPMKWAWKQYTGNPANDFNWDGIDAVCDYAYTKGMYCSLQPIIDGTGYYNTGSYTFLDGNFGLTDANKENTMRDFKGTTTAFTQNTNAISIWSDKIDDIYNYALSAFATHEATKFSTAILMTPPNEGWYTRNGVENTVDANTAWHTYLTNKYGTIGAINTAYGTSFGSIALVPQPRTTNDSAKWQYDWWTMRSNRASDLYTSFAQTLKTNAPNKIITSIKIINASAFTLDMGASGAGRIGFLQGIDLNNYLTQTKNYIDAVAYDAYPDQSSIRQQSLLLDIDYGFITGLANKINKPVYLSEVFPTVKSQAPQARSTFLAQQILQSLAYVGRNTNLGIRGLSVFSWKWSGCADTWGGGAPTCDPLLSIKDNNTENVLRQIIPLVKSEYKNAINTSSSQVAICNNTNLDIALNIRYFHDEPLWGFIDSMKRKTTGVNNYYSNNCIDSNETSMYVNQVNYNRQDFLDINSMSSNGKRIIVGYRGLEEQDLNYSMYGSGARNTQVSNFLGLNFTGITANTTVDVNVVDNNHLITSLLNIGDIVFRPINAGLGATGYETSTVTTAHMDANKSLNKSMISDTNNGVIKLNWNLADMITNNQYQSNWDKAMTGILNSLGVLTKPVDLNSSYGWETDNVTMFNAYGTTNYNYQPNNTAIYYYLKVTDNNTVSSGYLPSGNIDINLTNEQSIILTKDLNTLGLIDPNAPVTSIVKTKIVGTNDNNITLTCSSATSTCQTINYNVDNGGWQDSSINAHLPNQIVTIGGNTIRQDCGNGSTIIVEAGPSYLFDGNLNYPTKAEGIYRINTGAGGLFKVFFNLKYTDGTDENTTPNGISYLYYGLTSYAYSEDLHPTKAVQKITLYTQILNYNGYYCTSGWFDQLKYTYDKNFTTQLTGNQTTFVVSGAGSHTIQYYSQDTSAHTEQTKTYLWTDQFSTTTTTNVNYTIPDNNNTATITLTCTDSSYGCFNTHYSIDANATNILYTTPFTFTGIGKHIIYYYSTNNIGQSSTTQMSDLNMPVLVTVKYPKNIATLLQLTEKWRLRTIGGLTVNLTDLNADQNFYVQPNAVTNFYVVDVNGNYVENQTSRQYFADANATSTDTVQPYLYAISTSLATTITVVDATTNQAIPNIKIKIYGQLAGFGYTFINQVITDSKGQALALFIAGQSYTFDVYYNDSLLRSYNFTASSSNIYIALQLPTTNPTPNPAYGFDTTYIPVLNTIKKQVAGNLTLKATVYNLANINTEYVATISNNGNLMISQTQDVTNNTDSNHTFTFVIPFSDLNVSSTTKTGTLSVDITVITNGVPTTYHHNYVLLGGTLGETYNLVDDGLIKGLRQDVQCSIEPDPLTGLLPFCFPLMIVGILISIALVIVASFMMGQFQSQSAVIVFIIGLALFTYLQYTPVELIAAIVLIGLAFLVNERRS